jgi:hypothetical protein
MLLFLSISFLMKSHLYYKYGKFKIRSIRFNQILYDFSCIVILIIPTIMYFNLKEK